jgi:hypothetical protein
MDNISSIDELFILWDISKKLKLERLVKVLIGHFLQYLHLIDQIT